MHILFQSFLPSLNLVTCALVPCSWTVFISTLYCTSHSFSFVLLFIISTGQGMMFFNLLVFLCFNIVLLIEVPNFLFICILTQYFYDIFSLNFSLHILILLTNWFTNFCSTFNKFFIELHQVTLSVCPLSSGPPLTTLYSRSSPNSPAHLTCAAGNTAHCIDINPPVIFVLPSKSGATLANHL